MRKRHINLLSLLTLLLIAVSSCDKNELSATEFDLPSDKAYARFVLLSPGTPSVMIKVNDVKINGAFTSGSLGFFPSSATNPDYAAITPNANFKLSLPNIGTTNDSVLFFNSNIEMQAGKFYSVSLADTGKDRTVFAVEDKLGAYPADSFVNIRFINAMAKTGPLTLIRIDSSATAVTRDTIAKNIAFKSASDFITVRAAPKNGILRYRMVLSENGMSVGPQLSITTFSTMFRRSATIYAYGFGNGAVSTPYAPGILGLIYNQ